MQLLIDLATMAVMFTGGIPVTDLSLVRGDKLPLRITLLDDGVPVTPAGVRPALAIKSTLSDDTLVLAATNLEPVDDALGPAYVGSMSVNTTQLIAAMGSDESIDLLGEVVLIAGDGAQRTSSLIRVRVRQDIMPADAVPPEDVITDWSGLIAGAVVEALPDALHEAGVELTPATGQSTLSSGDAADTWTIVGGYAMTWGDEILAGHLPDSCRLTSISTVYFFTDPATNQYCLRIWKLVDGAYSLIGSSAYVSNLDSGQTATWVFTPGVTLQRGDVIIIQVCEGTEMTPYALGMHAVLTPSVPGRGLVAEVANPPAVNGTMAPLMTVVVDYDDGITLGGMELATARQLDSLGRDVRQSSATAEAAARTAGQSAATASTAADNAATSATAAANSATAAQQALEAMPQVDASGNMTLAGGLTAAGAVNANGGINIPLAVGAPTDTAAVNRLYAAGLAAVTEAFSSQSFLSSFSLYGGSVAVDQTVPGQVWKLSKTSADLGTVQVNLMNPFLGASNYSGWHGFILPAALGNAGSTAARKLTFALGKPGNINKRTAEDLDVFTLSPAQGNASSFLRIVDVTFYMVNDPATTPAGYPVRVRELVYDSAQAKWLCYETLSVIPSFNTNPSCNMFLSYQQDRPGRDVRAGLWIGSNAADSRRLLCIADMHGVVDTFSWTGVGALYWDSDGTNSHSYLGAMRQMTAPGYNLPSGAYDAFRALESRLIQSTSTYDFTPYE
ncbi:hypothetical protein [uncultured Akkermansia sp.]|uniref:hypothetical protein n=1 Tax=uncultured Akkermansia sp. TaxID=512294 RepID=UPI002610B4AF|nr:hypothetical protein [uncultured Akkermansia sp.]